MRKFIYGLVTGIALIFIVFSFKTKEKKSDVTFKVVRAEGHEYLSSVHNGQTTALAHSGNCKHPSH